MTAVNVLVLRDSVSIVTDTLSVQKGGHVFHTAKCQPLPHMRMAIAARGTMAGLSMMARLIQRECGDFDGAKQYLDRNFKSISVMRYDDLSERDAWAEGIDLFVAGWGRKGPSAFVISTLNTHYRAWDIDRLSVAPVLPQETFDRLSADPLASMPAILGAQTAVDVAVGGFMNVTTISEREVVSYSAGQIKRPQKQVGLPHKRLPNAFARHLSAME